MGLGCVCAKGGVTVGNGGVDGGDTGGSRTVSRRAWSTGLTVRMEGAGIVAVSEEVTTTGGAAELRFIGRYARYDGTADGALTMGSGGVSGSGVSDPVLVHRSISSCVVSRGKFSSIARPYRARLLSAYETT